MSGVARFKHVVQSGLKTLKANRYHYLSGQEARRALFQIELQQGKLSPVLKKQADTYAVEILGDKNYAPWLYVYSALAGEFKEGWIPDNYFGGILKPKIQGAYGELSFLKPLNNLLFKAEVCPDIAYFVNGYWFNNQWQMLSTKKLNTLLINASENLVYKTDTSYQGRGVFVFNRNTTNINTLESKGNGTLQTFITQHPFFDQFVLPSVANIRMTTVVENDGQIGLRASYLRLGRAIDSHVVSHHHIRVPLSLETGALYSTGYLANWEAIDQHPDSNCSFAKKVVPNFAACKNLVLELHRKMPMVLSIGWDVIVDAQQRVVVMEWNGYGNDIKFSEATQGPCFLDLNWNKG